MIKGVHFVKKRLTGRAVRWYVYAYRGGPQVMTADALKKPKLTAEALRLIADAQAVQQTISVPAPTTLLSLIRQWRSEDPRRPSSPEWEALSPNTKKTWGSALNRIEEKWGAVPLAVFNDPRMTSKVIAWRNSRRATPRAADIAVDVLRALLKFGFQQGLVTRNAADGIGRLYKNGQRAEIIWTTNDLRAFSDVAGAQDRDVDDAVQLGALTGMRREDLARLTWSDVRDFDIVKRAAKSSQGRRRFANIPRIPELDAILDRLRSRHRQPGVDTVLVTAAGRPWNLDTLSKEVTRIANNAGIIHVDPETGVRKRKHLHDVRGTFATKLMTATNLNNQEIAGIMGWSPEEVERIRRIYVDDSARNVALGQRIAGKL